MNTEKQNIFDSKIMVLAVLACSAAALVLLNTTTAPQKTVEGYLNDARQAVTSSYNIENAKGAFEGALSLDHSNELALYNLSRIYYIVNDYKKALETIATYKELYPENKRIHYIAGLANAYAGDLEQAQREFEDFVASGLATWPGYLDLAWAHFQQGEVEQARDVLLIAVEIYGNENAWLNTSLGGVYVALGENDAAVAVLEQAREAAGNITSQEWRQNFSFNDPAQVEREMTQMFEVIDFNLALAHNEEVNGAKVLGVPFADPSPLGARGGLVVSACGDACPHISCSATNVCGEANTGTQITCLGTCDAVAPADPTGTCEIATACGTASGYIGCNGVCNITSYPLCAENSNNQSGETTYITTEDDGDFDPSEAAVTIAASPTLVNSGDTSYVQWVATEMDSCAITGTNGDSWTGSYGSEQTSALTGRTTYTISCTAYDDSVYTDSTVVNMVPVWQEF